MLERTREYAFLSRGGKLASWQATAKPAIVEIVREGELAKIGSNVI